MANKIKLLRSEVLSDFSQGCDLLKDGVISFDAEKGIGPQFLSYNAVVNTALLLQFCCPASTRTSYVSTISELISAVRYVPFSASHDLDFSVSFGEISWLRRE